ncbi:nucleoside diphosphate kinase regulator [Xanthobacter autotrophicus DSM 431]|uniref:nucleoside diphosphate kinase regulator n=1 Tax=Xanthobacter nonsaccharivorans TaxID=3119912 RepID=UPI00372A9F51
MKTQPRSVRLPALVLSRPDHERLTGLATAALDRMPEVAEELLGELERARLVPAGKVPANAVQMEATVTYSSGGSMRTVKLVYPEDADIAAGRVSVMTPIGAALIGLSEGQSISWTARDGRRHTLQIIEVAPVGRSPDGQKVDQESKEHAR